MKIAIRKNFHDMSQGPPKPVLKKPLRELKNHFCFRFLWIPRTPERANWKQLVFLPSKNLYMQCEFDKKSLLASVCELTPKKETDIRPEGGKGCAYCACDTDTNFVFLPVLFAVGTSSM